MLSAVSCSSLPFHAWESSFCPGTSLPYPFSSFHCSTVHFLSRYTKSPCKFLQALVYSTLNDERLPQLMVIVASVQVVMGVRKHCICLAACISCSVDQLKFVILCSSFPSFHVKVSQQMLFPVPMPLSYWPIGFVLFALEEIQSLCSPCIGPLSEISEVFSERQFRSFRFL